jgi:hypothetical protein
MAHLVEQHSSHQYRVDSLAATFGQDQRLQITDASEGVIPQRFELVDAMGEQLGQPGLGTVHTEATLEFPQF